MVSAHIELIRHVAHVARWYTRTGPPVELDDQDAADPRRAHPVWLRQDRGARYVQRLELASVDCRECKTVETRNILASVACQGSSCHTPGLRVYNIIQFEQGTRRVSDRARLSIDFNVQPKSRITKVT